MPRPEPQEIRERFLRKARSDLVAARALSEDIDQDDAVIGFHAQQTVEKALKAVLATILPDEDPPRTHDINFLLGRLRRLGVRVPSHLTAGRLLAPWAVTARYDDIEDDLDRIAAVKIAAEVLAWAERFEAPA